MHGVSKCKNRRCVVCNIIKEGKSYTFEKTKITFIINRNLSFNSKNVVYIIKYTNYNEIYIGYIKALNNESNITLPENRKLFISEYLYECSKETLK